MDDEPRPVEAADILKIRFLSEPALSPDGRQVVFVVAHAHEDSNEYRAHLWIAAADGTGKARQFTHGNKRDGHPVWSPDGRWIAFTTSRSGHKEIWLIPADGGEARRLTYTVHGAGNPSWAPDSRALAFTTAVDAEDPPPQAHAFDTDDEAKKRKEKREKAKKEEPLHVTRLRYKQDSEGLWEGRYTHIWVQALDADGDSVGDPRPVTDGDYEDSPAVWSPDGRYLAFASNRIPDPDRTPISDIFVVPAAGGPPQQMTASAGMAHSPAWSPDGAALAYVGHERGPEWGYGSNNILYMVPFQPGESTAAQRRDLSGRLDRPVDNMSLSDSRLGSLINYPIWTADGQAIDMLVSDWGRVGLRRFPVQGAGAPVAVLAGDRAITNLAFSADRRRVAFVAGDLHNPGDLFSADLAADGTLEAERQVTHVNAKLFAGLQIAQGAELRFTSPEGVELQGWVIKPPGFTAGQHYPAVLSIHGGPHLMYGFAFFHEFQVLAAQGYVVFCMNPRGSQGYGQAFADAIRGGWGEPDYADLMQGVDVLLQQGYVDPQRLGVSGGSYGGYMTCWIAGHTSRFQAAVASRPVTNLISMYGASDAGWMLEDWEFTELFGSADGYAVLWKYSPLAYAPQISTPLLLTHGEQDLRCPIGQSEEMFVALKRDGKATALVRFPGASHELSRAGAPKMRVGRLDAIVGWLRRYLET
ncbi:MAG TPA: S9 family peptidase [Chloroflexia bacterium]|nr:S9 family peptidase [Chloroflexia bacterium]